MDKPSPQNTEKTAHAGNLPLETRETPIKDFDNTTLSQAVDSDFIRTPDSPADLIQDGPKMPASLYEGTPPNAPFAPTTSFENTPEKKVKKSPLTKIIVSLAGLSLAATGTLFAVSNSNQPPKEEPVATAPAEPSPETTAETPPIGDVIPMVTPENRAEIVESYKISATLSPEQVGEKFLDTLSKARMAGTTTDTFNNRDRGVDLDIFATESANANSSALNEALFGEASPEGLDESSQVFVNGVAINNHDNIVKFISTYGDKDQPNTNTKNKEIWDTSTEYLGISDPAVTETTLSLRIHGEEINNGAENMYDNFAQYNGTKADYIVKFVNNNGTYEIESISVEVL